VARYSFLASAETEDHAYSVLGSDGESVSMYVKKGGEYTSASVNGDAAEVAKGPAKIEGELLTPEYQLYQLLADNYYRHAYVSKRAYESGHQERMDSINKVLENDGGGITVNAAIKLVDGYLTEANREIDKAKVEYRDHKKKHPVKFFFGDMVYEQCRQRVRNSQYTQESLDNIKRELVAAMRLNNVIEQSRYSKSP